jgi:hypothetical protein
MADPITNLGQIAVIPQIAASKFLITDANGLPSAATAAQLVASHKHSTLSAPDGSPSPAVSVDDSGRFGVATTSPTGQLQVEGHTHPLAVLRHTAVGEVYDENARIYIDHKRENLAHGITAVLPTDSVMLTRSVIGPIDGLDGGIKEIVVNTGLDTQEPARTLRQIAGHLAIDVGDKDGTNTKAFPDASTMVAIQNNGVTKATINGAGALKLYGYPAGAEVSTDPLLTVSTREGEDLFLVKDDGGITINAPQLPEDPRTILNVAVDGSTILNLNSDGDFVIEGDVKIYDSLNVDASEGSIPAVSIHNDSDGGGLSVSASATGAALFSVTNGNGYKVYVLADGKVGIGTATPTHVLHVHDESNNQTIHLTGAATGQESTDGIYLSVAGTVDAVLQNMEAGYLAFGTTGTERMRILADGKVGIGTTAPKSPLHVVGLPVYANNTAAIAGGLTAGAFYRTGADPDPVCVVH